MQNLARTTTRRTTKIFRKLVKPPKNQNSIKNSTENMKISPKNKKSCEEEEEQQQQHQQQQEQELG